MHSPKTKWRWIWQHGHHARALLLQWRLVQVLHCALQGKARDTMATKHVFKICSHIKKWVRQVDLHSRWIIPY